MTLNINGKILATIYVAGTALVVAAVTSAGGISMITPAFAQGGNMTDGGNTTEGSMPPPPPDAGGGMGTPPPAMTP
jgi:hypothetical protein